MNDGLLDVDDPLLEVADVIGVASLVAGVVAGLGYRWWPAPTLAWLCSVLFLAGAVLVLLSATADEEWPALPISEWRPVDTLGLLAGLVGVGLVPIGLVPALPFAQTVLAGGGLFVGGAAVLLARYTNEVAPAPLAPDASDVTVPDDPMELLEEDDDR